MRFLVKSSDNRLSLNPIIKLSIFCIFIIIGSSANPSFSNAQDEYDLTLSDIQIRDPNITYYNGYYYMTGTTAEDGFLGYKSEDLCDWKSIGYIYRRNSSNYWAQYHFWAPEITSYNSHFYLFYTGKAEGHNRGTGVAVAETPEGPFIDLKKDPLTPSEYQCLDGHLFQHPNGTLYFIYVYEWLNEGNGAMWIQEVSSNLTHLMGDPVQLFEGPDPQWGNTVVDGPSMLYFEDTYYLFWSTFDQTNDGKYCVGYSYSDDIYGPYTHAKKPIVRDDGGHSTYFYEKNNISKTRYITYHQPNAGPERAQIRELVFDSEDSRWYVIPPEEGPIPAYIFYILAGIALLGISAILLIIKRQKIKKNPKAKM